MIHKSSGNVLTTADSAYWLHCTGHNKRSFVRIIHSNRSFIQRTYTNTKFLETDCKLLCNVILFKMRVNATRDEKNVVGRPNRRFLIGGGKKKKEKRKKKRKKWRNSCRRLLMERHPWHKTYFQLGFPPRWKCPFHREIHCTINRT